MSSTGVVASIGFVAFSFVALSGCATTTRQTVQMGSATTTVAAMTPEDVAAQVQVIRRDRDTIYRAPTLRVGSSVIVQRAGPVAGANLGSSTLGRSGYLLGVRRRDSGEMRHFAAYNSDFIEGTNRFVSVQSADGRALQFSLASASQDSCPGGCKLTFQTLMIQVPEADLRAVPDSGLTFTVKLDNGYQFPITAPAAYVRGYLQAIASASR